MIDNVPIIQEYYGYSKEKAIQALTILTEEDILAIREEMFTGGRQKPPKK